MGGHPEALRIEYVHDVHQAPLDQSKSSTVALAIMSGVLRLRYGTLIQLGYAVLISGWQGKGVTGQVIQLTLCIETDLEADAEELAMLAVDLRGLLLELDIQSADPLTRGPAPPGTRAGEMFVVGALTVMLAWSKELVTKLIESVQWWVSLGAGRRVRIELDGDVLELNGLTREDQRKLIQLFIDRHTDG
ncbi:MAG: hypothetical protein ACRDRA_21935 [Pseudonocardiaceae bacterium]